MANTTQKTLADLFAHGLRDMYHAEKKILRALPGMIRAARDPALKEALSAHREETQDQGLALGMVAKQRTELAVVNEFVLRAYVQRQPEVPLLALRVVDEVQAHCLLSEHPALPPARIQAAIRRMIDKGRLDEVLANYR